ncbi:MAG: hypothetical protein QXM31_01555 [Candidatus Woesearchaeota archaeon]
MMLPGRYAAKMDLKGRVLLPEYFRKSWNSRRVFAATELSESGLYVACYQRLPDRNEYLEYMRARHNPASAEFAELEIDRQNRIQVGRLCRAARIENPLLFVSTGMPAFNSTYCIELWNANDFERAEKQLQSEIGSALSRVYHVPQQ